MPNETHARAAIPLPIEVCWEKLRDLTAAKHYVPGLSDCVITTDLKEGVGASRVVTHHQFGAMNETVVAWDEGKGITIRLHKGDKGPSPMKKATVRYELHPTAEGCEVHMAMSWEMPFGILGKIMDALVMRRMFTRNMSDVAVSVAEYYRTGEPVEPGKLEQLRANAL